MATLTVREVKNKALHAAFMAAVKWGSLMAMGDMFAVHEGLSLRKAAFVAGAGAFIGVVEAYHSTTDALSSLYPPSKDQGRPFSIS